MVYCEKCGCEDIKYFGFKNEKAYCRRCIIFSSEIVTKYENSLIDDLIPQIKYSLTKEQEEISNLTTKAILEKKNVLIYAVCGAGKTEIVFDIISKIIKQKKQVGFCIPRKDVVIELQDRFKEAFPNIKIVSLYGGHTNQKTGDLILLTTHQLYQYKNYFDLLIIDETDAFPYSNNDVLKKMFDDSIKGNYIMMSATPQKWMKEKIKKENGIILSLFKRFHGHKIIIPELVITPFLMLIKLIDIIDGFQKEKLPCLIFVPTKYDAENLTKKLKPLFNDIQYVHSQRENRDQIIKEFKNGKFNYLITTSILERGITIKNIQVIVYNADHEVFDKDTLIQISGRVGRKKDSYDGKVIFLAKKSTISIENCINEVKEANRYAGL